MLMTVNELRQRIDCGDLTDDVIRFRLDSIEAVIRAYTNNNFQNRSVRFTGHIEGFNIYGTPAYLHAGDTIMISESINADGLAVVVSVADDHITVDKSYDDEEHVLVTLVKYPVDVIQCALDMFGWSLNNADKIGIKSETISRHSVTYEDSTGLYMGYPVGILNGLNLHRKVRF